MSTFIRATILTLLCVNAACLDGAPGNAPTSQATSQSITGVTVLPATGWGEPGQPTPTIAADGSVSWCCTTWYVQLPLGVGDTIASISTTVRDNGAANGFATSGNNVIVALIAQTSGGPTSLGSITSDGSGNLQSKTLTLSTPYTVPQGVSLVLKAIALTGGAVPGPALHPSMIGAIVIPPVVTRSAVPFSASWRVQWNGGFPIVTIHGIQAPPGVQVGIRALGLKAAAEVDVAAPAMKSGTLILSASHGTGLDYTDRFSVGLQAALGSGGTGNPVSPATTDDVALVATDIPSVVVAPGDNVLHGRIISRFITNTGISNMYDTSLDDAVIRVVGTLGF